MTAKIEWLARLYKDNAAGMWSAALPLLGDPKVAEDVVQDVFVVLLLKQEEVRQHNNPKGWLYKTLFNRIKREQKRQSYRNYTPLENVQVEAEDIYEHSLNIILPSQLTKEERNILQMYFEEQLSYEQIAHQLGCSIPACRTRLFRAKERCKKLLYEDIDAHEPST